RLLTQLLVLGRGRGLFESPGRLTEGTTGLHALAQRDPRLAVTGLRASGEADLGERLGLTTERGEERPQLLPVAACLITARLLHQDRAEDGLDGADLSLPTRVAQRVLRGLGVLGI